MPKDDRGDAVGWYIRHRLLEEERRGVTQGEVRKRTGIGQGHISQLRNGHLRAGLATAIRIAPLFGLDPGQLVNTALEWWEKRGGRAWAIEQERLDYEERRARLKKTSKTAQ
jgi:transcriptional regulator with XRE-family HTH domain